MTPHSFQLFKRKMDALLVIVSIISRYQRTISRVHTDGNKLRHFLYPMFISQAAILDYKLWVVDDDDVVGHYNLHKSNKMTVREVGWLLVLVR